MARSVRAMPAVATIAFVLAVPAAARADETDNFTCRARQLTDALPLVDEWLNARIDEAVGRASRRAGCDEACLFRELQRAVGATDRRPLTFIPHARLARWIERQPGIDRCHLAFRDSIYGARPYNQPWLFPFHGRIIFLADSIRLSGRVIGVDKINHFLREGLKHWRDVQEPGGDIARVMARELGPPGRQWRMNERGLRGMSLTGVVAYADLAASYSGFTFWSELLSVDRPGSFLTRTNGQYARRKTFTFAAYVNDAWDEAINCSEFDARLGREVAAALHERFQECAPAPCAGLAVLPGAELFVNPACLPAESPGAPARYRMTRAAPTVQ